jgi:hypothetical protein
MPNLGKIEASTLEGKRLYWNGGSVRQVLHFMTSTMEKLIVEPGDLFVGDDLRELKNADFFFIQENKWCMPVGFADLNGRILAERKGFRTITGKLTRAPFEYDKSSKEWTFVDKKPEPTPTAVQSGSPGKTAGKVEIETFSTKSE